MKNALFLAFMITARVLAALPSYEHCTYMECETQELVLSVTHQPANQSRSLNWSGYAALTNLTKPKNFSVTDVQGQWRVPELSCSFGGWGSYSAIWVGMDGYISQTVEQIGTEQDWVFLMGQQNFAWFEMYPGPAFKFLNFPVNVGDHIGAEVEYLGHNEFQLTIVNYTEGMYTFTIQKSKNALRNSANWIVEAPSSSAGILPLADFGKVKFKDCMATIKGVTGPINSPSWQNDAITMVRSQCLIKSKPSRLSKDGENFTVTWNSP